MLFPWPGRPQRQDAIAAAEREKHRSQAAAGRAALVETEIRRLADQNHWAAAVAATLRNGKGA